MRQYTTKTLAWSLANRELLVNGGCSFLLFHLHFSSLNQALSTMVDTKQGHQDSSTKQVVQSSENNSRSSMNGLFVKGQTPGMGQYPYSLWSCLGPGEEMVSLKKKDVWKRPPYRTQIFRKFVEVPSRGNMEWIPRTHFPLSPPPVSC